MMQELFAEQPNRWDGNFDLGHVFYQLGQLSTAEPYLKRAQQLNPTVPFPYLYLGLTYLRMNRFQDAEANLRQAVFVRPYEPFLHFSLASILVAEAKCDEARVEFRTSLDLDPDMPHVQDQLDNCGKPRKN
jgi:Tfp pilus assembly protein PilF